MQLLILLGWSYIYVRKNIIFMWTKNIEWAISKQFNLSFLHSLASDGRPESSCIHSCFTCVLVAVRCCLDVVARGKQVRSQSRMRRRRRWWQGNGKLFFCIVYGHRSTRRETTTSSSMHNNTTTTTTWMACTAGGVGQHRRCCVKGGLQCWCWCCGERVMWKL